MKKSLYVLMMVLGLRAVCHADSGDGSMNHYGVKMWISSTIVNPQTNVLFSSGPMCIHSVFVASPTVNQEPSFIQFFESTSTAFGSWVSSLTPKINLNVVVGSTAGWSSGSLYNPPPPFDLFVSSYLFYHKTSSAPIAILYDWTNAAQVYPGSYFNGSWPKR